MDIKYDVVLVRELLNLTQKELATELNVAFSTINRWENGKSVIEPQHLQNLYSYAYKRGIFLNSIHEQFFKEEYQNPQRQVLFHGAKSAFSLPVTLENSKLHNDFGIGFYLGESFAQAASYISPTDSSFVYAFYLTMDKLSQATFTVNLDWMLAIAYFRGWIDAYADRTFLQHIVEKVRAADVIIAPIADNRMFDIIAEFVHGDITDLQCEHALSATNLGMQYVVRSDKAAQHLTFLQKMYVCPLEKDSLLKNRLENNRIGQDKVKAARIAYRGKGKYIDELLL